ncbi:hypothetical protein FQN50_002565 [Emmonsiellopsis sp. PD_5]|nr:hypothetical protein FQN50_002565 [Emmonsiellopsis sp. PD_5]
MQRQAPPPAVNLHTPHYILSQPLPRILTREHYRTTSSALHSSYYAKKLVRWNISTNVKAATADTHLKKDPLDADVQVILQSPFRVKAEHYLCGDEQSVCGRYSHNALEPVTAVAYLHGLRVRFGDHKASQENHNSKTKHYIPDFAGMFCPALDFTTLSNLTKDNPKHQPQMRIVGEAKTHWRHNLTQFFKAATKAEDKDKDETHLRHALGQIAAYMHLFEMRFAFLTTYDCTIFLMQDVVGEDNEPVLYFTEPIRAQPDNENTPSVRQYLYFLMLCASQGDNFKFTNTTPFDEWVVGDAADLPKYQVPITPVTRHSLILDNFYQMTPAPRSETSESERMPLYTTASRDWYSTTLQYPTKRIYNSTTGRYVIINNQTIEVELFGQPGSEDGNNQGSDDNNNKRSGHDNGRGSPTRHGHAPIKATAHNRFNQSGSGLKSASKRSFADRMMGVENTPTSTHTTTPVAQLDMYHSSDDHGSHFYMQERDSPSPAGRFGSQQDLVLRGREIGYEVRRPSPLGRHADRSQYLSGSKETEEERVRCKTDEKNKKKKPVAVAAVDAMSLTYRDQHPKDDDDDKGDRKSSNIITTTLSTRPRRSNR